MDQLQPIETAPRDGTWVLLFGPSGYTTTPLRCEVARWYPSYRPLNPWQNHSNDAFTDGGPEPTHWMPLPLDPAPGSEADLEEYKRDQAELSALREDKARLDWLDAGGEPETFEDAPHALVWTVIGAPGPQRLRAAIDAAMEATP